jgi:Protein of unknown function (DUF3187)
VPGAGDRGASGRGWYLAAALLLPALPICCIAPGAARADEFFLVRDENPLIRALYLPLPSDSRLDAGQVVSATLLVSNTLNVQSDSQESLHVDGESDTLSLTYGNALFESWRYRVTVPVIHDSGGFLDPVIETWHQVFGLPQGSRPQYPDNKLVYSYSGRGANIDLHQAQTSIGDISGELGWYALDNERRTLSIWGGLEAPTGSVSKLTGDGAWDGALWLHTAMRWPQWQLAMELGVAQPCGDEIFAGEAHKTSAFTRLAATRTLGPAWSLRAQLDAQTGRVAGSDMRFLGPSLQLTVGAQRRLRGRWRVEFGFAEDAGVNTVPDIAFFLGIRG